MTKKIKRIRSIIEKSYTSECNFSFDGFDEILFYELHSQPVYPRIGIPTSSGFETGLIFKELAQKWGINVSLLGELIANHCKKLDD